MNNYSMEFPMDTFDENDLRKDPRPEATEFSKMLGQVLSRRQLLGAAGAGIGLFLGGQGMALAANTASITGPRIGFKPQRSWSRVCMVACLPQSGISLTAKPTKAQSPMTSITLRLYLKSATAAPKAMRAERTSNAPAKPSGHNR